MSTAEETDSFDALAGDLRALRHEAGSPSFTEIAVRVGRIREARGAENAGTRPARTTVYDTFRAGRSRMDGALAADIAEALGASDPQAWRERCGRIQFALEQSRSRTAHPTDSSPEPPPERTPSSSVPARPRRALLLAGCVVLNLLGILVIRVTGLPLYFDTIGISFAAMAFGPWMGVLVAVLTHLLSFLLIPHSSLWFLAVSVACALVWGYGWRLMRGWGAQSPPITLHLAVGVVSSLVATPILWFRFHGFGEHAAGQLQNVFAERIPLEWLTLFLTNLSTSLPDKVLSGLVAAALIPVLLRTAKDLGSPDSDQGTAGPQGALPRRDSYSSQA